MQNQPINSTKDVQMEDTSTQNHAPKVGQKRPRPAEEEPQESVALAATE